jgi:Zn-dependent protease with chaperone function
MLIERMELLARTRPTMFRWRVQGTLALGYGFLAGLVGMPMLVCAAAFYPFFVRDAMFKILVGVLAAILAVSALIVAVRKSPRAASVALPGDNGERAAAPDLYRMVDALCARLDLPSLREIRITPEFGASLHRAGGGVFEKAGGTLLIGLPLMKCLSHAQLEAALAHELGHLSGVHERWMVRVAHLERTVRSLRAALESSRRGAGRALRRACEWYLERLHACALPASRACEYEADRTAARLTSPSKLAEALAVLAVGERFWRQRYWPIVYADIRHVPYPVRFPHTSFGILWLTALGTEQARAWLDAALLSKTACAHLSPALSDRIRALDADPVLALAEHETADRLLGAERARLDAIFDSRWREAVAEPWRRIYQAIHAPAPPKGAV